VKKQMFTYPSSVLVNIMKKLHHATTRHT